MKFYFTKKWNDTSIRYDQTKRIIEKFLADLKISKDVNFWLESCNVCSCCCAIESVDGKFKFELPKVKGKEFVTYADMMFCYTYSTEMYKKDGICDNEIQANLVKAINDMSDTKATVIRRNFNVDVVNSMKQELMKKNACVLSYLTDYGTGHYICIVAYDEVKDIFYGYDSWSENKHCKTKGILEIYESNFICDRIRNKSFISVEGSNDD